MSKFTSDILKEDLNDDKYSSKKTMGILTGVLVCISFLGDGFHWFSVNETLFNSMLVFSATMLGVSTIPKITKAFSKGSAQPK
jgi:hypothetical protein